jgi:hypothetical protein
MRQQFYMNKSVVFQLLLCFGSFPSSTYDDLALDTHHGASRNSSTGRRCASRPGEQGGQASAFLARQPKGLITLLAFRLRNIADEESLFFNCLHALPEATVGLISDLVKADPLPTNQYTELRYRFFCCLSADRHTAGAAAPPAAATAVVGKCDEFIALLQSVDFL